MLANEDKLLTQVAKELTGDERFRVCRSVNMAYNEVTEVYILVGYVSVNLHTLDRAMEPSDSYLSKRIKTVQKIIEGSKNEHS